LTRAGFKNRFIAELTAITGGEYEPFFEFAAMSAWETYRKYSEDMTPEDHAREEAEAWGR
jgi:hypothetical protein